MTPPNLHGMGDKSYWKIMLLNVTLLISVGLAHIAVRSLAGAGGGSTDASWAATLALAYTMLLLFYEGVMALRLGKAMLTVALASFTGASAYLAISLALR